MSELQMKLETSTVASCLLSIAYLLPCLLPMAIAYCLLPIALGYLFPTAYPTYTLWLWSYGLGCSSLWLEP